MAVKLESVDIAFHKNTSVTTFTFGEGPQPDSQAQQSFKAQPWGPYIGSFQAHLFVTLSVRLCYGRLTASLHVF